MDPLIRSSGRKSIRWWIEGGGQKKAWRPSYVVGERRYGFPWTLCLIFLKEAMKVPQAVARRRKNKEGLESIDHRDVADEGSHRIPWTL